MGQFEPSFNLLLLNLALKTCILTLQFSGVHFLGGQFKTLEVILNFQFSI